MKVYSLLKTTFSNILDIEDNSDMGLNTIIFKFFQKDM